MTGFNVVGTDALLAPIGNYGGPTKTMALRPGSPARNAGSPTARTTDQRGFPIVGIPDIGAYEAGTVGNLASTLAETLPSTGPASSVTPEGDFDGDGATNQDETTAGTVLTDPTSVFRAVATRSGGNLIITFPSVTGKTYRLERSDTLATGSWTTAGLPAVTGDGTVKQFTVTATTPAQRFFRVATP